MIEVAAVALTVLCVLLAVKRSIWQFPTGIAATALYVFVFFEAHLYASAALNVAFSFVQFYGWWFWLRGDAGRAPQVGSWPWAAVTALVAAALIGAALLAYVLQSFTDAALPYADAAIFGLSLAAQFLLSRKKIQTWPVWAIVNTMSVVTYASQGLWPTAWLYAGLLLNTAWGWVEWRKAMRAEGTLK